mgnify:CR=1 FL=1
MTLLQGDREYLRRLEQSDLERTLQWVNDPDVFLMMGTFGPRTSAAQDQWYRSVAVSSENLVFAVCLRKDDRHIGNVSLFDIDFRNRNAGLTVVLPETDHQGQGLGREAVALLCDYAFSYLNLHRVYCKTDNVHAEKMYSRLGFTREGCLRQQAYHSGQYIDKIIYGILRNEFTRT